MEKKDLDWSNLGFGYMVTDYRYVSNYKDGKWATRQFIFPPEQPPPTVPPASGFPFHDESQSPPDKEAE